jgi:hypothetical protein
MGLIKRIKRRINKFNTFKYLNPESNNNVIVTMVNADSKNLAEQLGISEERVIELAEEVSNMRVSTDPLMAEVMAEISKICKHPNELSYLVALYASNGRISKDLIKRIYDYGKKAESAS